MADILGLIGAGNMAGAILGGVLRGGVFPPGQVWVSNRSEGKLSGLSDLGVHTTPDNRVLAEAASVIILCVKPQVFPVVLPEIGPAAVGKTVVSISPGYSLATLGSALPGCHVVRAMPNTPLLVGKGCTALVESPGIPPDRLETVREIFSSAGEVFSVPEGLMDAVVSIAGSSPAYFFRIAAVMAKWAEEAGMDAETAGKMAAVAMEGASRMLLESGKSPRELVRQVCSPGGTTLAALSAFDEMGLDETIEAGLDRCALRAGELGR